MPKLVGGGLAAIAAFALLLGHGEAHSLHHYAHHHRHHAAHAAWHHSRHHARHAAANGPVHASILIDADNGKVLSESNADAITYPASLTKMMTLYLTFQALNQGRLTLDQRLPVSALAASEQPTKLGLKAGDSVTVRNLILGIVTRSANDAAVVLAEGIAGSQAAFAERMNAKARQLGMTRTVYHNASGLPDPAQHTTARDVARLALALYRGFPHDYHYFSTPEFDFRGQTITTHNHLLEWYRGADGIKTGYIHASGFNLAASAVRDGHRLIGVIMGGSSARTRDRRMAALLDSGFAEIAEAGAPATRVAAAPHHPASATSAASRLAAHLSPISRAEAAPVVHRQAARPAHKPRLASAKEKRWSVQLGAFRAKKTARRVAHNAARLPIAKGRPVRIIKPAKGAKPHLYRTQVAHFTKEGAHRACARLEKRDIPCAVVRTIRVANR